MAMAMAVACREPRFLELDEAIKDRELRKQKTETGDTNAPIVDHVQKFNTEEGYDGEVELEWNNGFILEENEHIQKDDTEEAKKEEEKERKEDSDSDEELCLSNFVACDPNTKSVCCLANASLKWYNTEAGSNYKLKRVSEARLTLVNGLNYEITFIAEEGGSDDEPDEPALEYLEWNEPDEKVVYSSGDDKPSDKLFEGAVYWMRTGYIEVLGCEIKTNEEKDNTEEANKDLCNTVLDIYTKRVRSIANKSLKANNRKTHSRWISFSIAGWKKKHIRTPGNPRRSLNRPVSKKERILWLALWIGFYYIIWIVLSKTRVTEQMFASIKL